MSDFLRQVIPLLIFAVVVALGVWGVRRYLRRQRSGYNPTFKGSGGGRSSSEDSYPRRKE